MFYPNSWIEFDGSEEPVEPVNFKRHFKYWGAAYILAVLWVGSWIGQWFTMLPEIEKEGYTVFWAATFENWQSEWLQLLVQAVMLLGMKHILFKADAEDMEQVQNDLKEIKEHLNGASK